VHAEPDLTPVDGKLREEYLARLILSVCSRDIIAPGDAPTPRCPGMQAWTPGIVSKRLIVYPTL